METAAHLRSFIITNFYVAEPGALGDEVSLLGSGIVDSTSVLEIVLFLEEQFGIQVKDDEMLADNLDSIGKIARFIARKKAA
jgi:acyl carrier protein